MLTSLALLGLTFLKDDTLVMMANGSMLPRLDRVVIIIVSATRVLNSRSRDI
jgi:hypothetical protein